MVNKSFQANYCIYSSVLAKKQRFRLSEEMDLTLGGPKVSIICLKALLIVALARVFFSTNYICTTSIESNRNWLSFN